VLEEPIKWFLVKQLSWISKLLIIFLR
jgi:hypothetical protein